MSRILHLIASNHRRGAETFAVELAIHQRRLGHDVRVMAVTAGKGRSPLDVEVAGRSRSSARGFEKILSACGWADVIVSFGSSSLLTGALASSVSRKPFIYRTIGDPSEWGKARLANLRVGVPARSAARVVALFPGSADELVRRYGIDRQLIRIIPRGVPVEKFPLVDTALRADARASIGLDPDRRWVAYVGALSPEKDPILALEVLEHLDPDVGLVVAGDGPMATTVREMAQRHGDRVKFLGAVEAIAEVYAASDALVLPSRTEGIPGAAIEAGLSGLPVVASDVGGLRYVVEPGSTGFLVRDRNPNSMAGAIERAIDDRATMGTAGREHCLARFSMDAVGEAWAQLLDEVATGRSPG